MMGHFIKCESDFECVFIINVMYTNCLQMAVDEDPKYFITVKFS